MVTQELPTTTTVPTPSFGERLGSLWTAFKQTVKQPFYSIYERRLAEKVADWKLPGHIGIIMDGNRRFARGLGMSSVSDGHQKGAEKLWEALNWCYDAGVNTVTVWCFSIDNFERDAREVKALLDLFEEKTRELAEHDEVHAREVRLRYIGEIDRLPDSLQEAIRTAEEATRDYSAYRLNIAMAYGGREEITAAFKNFLTDRSENGESLSTVADSFSPEMIEPYLYTSGQPEPDLIIRTSGEVRLSGFLLWQSAYSEYYFCDTHWPAFRKIDFYRALRSYDDRHRRFGR